MANFPSSVSTNSNLYIAVNGIQTTLAVSILATDTTIQLTSTTGFPTTGYVTIDNSEVVLYTGISGPNLTGCVRGSDGTTAAAHSLGVTVGATIVAAHHNLLKDEIIAIETALGAGYLQTSAPTANAVVQRDANANTQVNSLLEGYSTTATSAGTTTLTVSSSYQQYFTGTTTQTVILPVVSTLVIGQQYLIVNLSTGIVTVQSSGGNTLQAMASNTQLLVTVISTSGTGTASWNWQYSALTTIPVGLGGTGDTTLSAHAVLLGEGTSPVGTASPSVTSGVPLVSNGSSSDPSFGAVNLASPSAVTGTLPNSNTTATSSPTASDIVSRDSNANTQVNTVVENFTTTVTAAGTTVLTASSSPIQQFTGTTTQTVTLPDCTTLSTGYQITVLNRSTGSVSVNNNGGSLQQSIGGGSQFTFTCTNTGSANGTWDVSSAAGSGTVTSVSGTTNQITSTNPTTTPTLALANPLTLPGPMTAGGNIAMASNKITGLANGTASTDASAFGQVTPLFAYRRPTLVYSSGTVVTVETGIVDGTSGDATILFSDGNLRTETASSRYNMTITQNAVFNNATLGSNQGGLRTGSVANNTWYACYAVKVTTFSANWVLVADTVLPLQTNYSTLNTNFGTNGWVYLGMIRYGDQSGTANAIPFFAQIGSVTMFRNTCTGNTGIPGRGIRMATTAAATGLTYSYAFGTSGTQIPNNVSYCNYWQAALNPGTTPNIQVFENNASGYQIADMATGGVAGVIPFEYGFLTASPSTLFMRASNSESTSKDFFLIGFSDLALGVGSNPLL